jgi:hypothetical protein
MSNQVYANMMEVSCKAAAGKSICAFPDVCMTPPQTPATPPGVPIPYPNSGLASDATDGSSSVKISGQEVMLKNKSYFKKSTGDEAGCAPKKGLMSSKNMGKVYFTMWSMDVKVEGENVVRHLDMTTHNHGSNPNEAIPWPHIDAQTMKAGGGDCKDNVAAEKKACADYEPYKKGGKDVCAEAGLSGPFSKDKATSTKRAKSASSDPCSAARRCRLVPFNAKPEDGINGCCPAQTGDHIVPKSSFFVQSVDNGKNMPGWGPDAAGKGGYSIAKAPCMCLEGGSCTGSHGLRHAHHKATAGIASGTHRPFADEVKHCAKGAKKVAPKCDEACIEAQLMQGHEGMGDASKPVKYSPTGKNFLNKVPELLAKIKEMLTKLGPPTP